MQIDEHVSEACPFRRGGCPHNKENYDRWISLGMNIKIDYKEVTKLMNKYRIEKEYQGIKYFIYSKDLYANKA